MIYTHKQVLQQIGGCDSLQHLKKNDILRAWAEYNNVL